MGGRNPVSTADVLREIQERGIILQVQSGEIRYRAPSGRLTPELRAALVKRKPEILAVLQSKQTATGYGLCPGPEKCAGCYAVGVVDGRERFLHPPKGKPIDWSRWTPVTEKVQ